jgi:hypothetical protein
MKPQLVDLQAAVTESQQRFARLASHLAADGGQFSVDTYARFLTMQYHLTRGVQRYFFRVAGHSSLARRKSLRAFLVRFANEEELHYIVAGSDLAKLGKEVGPCPLDVKLWHAFFESTINEQPFLRLGAAVVLENLTAGEARAHVRNALGATFLTKENTKFVAIHQHESLPHGVQFLEALESMPLTKTEIADLSQGARVGAVLYLRMAEWALDPECLAASADFDLLFMKDADRRDIKDFTLQDLADD